MSYYKNLIESIKDISEKCDWSDYYTALDLPQTQDLDFGLAVLWSRAYLYHHLEIFDETIGRLTKGIVNEQFNDTGYTKLADFIKAVSDHAQRPKSIDGHVGDSLFNRFTSLRFTLDELKDLSNLKKGESIYSTSFFRANHVTIFDKPFIGTKQDYKKFLKLLVDSLSSSDYDTCIHLNGMEHNVVVATTANQDLIKLFEPKKLEVVACKPVDYSRYQTESLIDDILRTLNSEVGVPTNIIPGQQPLFTLNVLVYAADDISKSLVINSYKDRLDSDLQQKLRNARLDILNELNGYINSWRWKHHKKRATYTRSKISAMNNNMEDVYNFITEELSILNRTFESSEQGGEKHYKDNRLSSASTHSLENSAYKRIISESIEKFNKIYSEKIIGNIYDYENGVLKNIYDKGYYTDRRFLYIACYHGHTKIVEELMNREVDITIPSGPNGQTHLFIACKKGHLEIVRLLLGRYEDRDSSHEEEKRESFYKKNISTSQKIVDPKQIRTNVSLARPIKFVSPFQNKRKKLKNSELNSHRKDKKTALFIACQYGRTEIVKLLIEKGADSTKAAEDRQTPMSIAGKNGYQDIVDILSKAVVR